MQRVVEDQDFVTFADPPGSNEAVLASALSHPLVAVRGVVAVTAVKRSTLVFAMMLVALAQIRRAMADESDARKYGEEEHDD